METSCITEPFAPNKNLYPLSIHDYFLRATQKENISLKPQLNIYLRDTIHATTKLNIRNDKYKISTTNL